MGKIKNNQSHRLKRLEKLKDVGLAKIRRMGSDMDICKQEIQNNTKSTIPNSSNPSKDDQEHFGYTEPKKNLIMTCVGKFLQQQSDFSWLTQPFDHAAGSDHFKNLVIHSTFPTELNQNDFDYYIDMTFNDFPTNLRTRMKDFYHESNQNPALEDIIFTDHENGAVSATLVQILSQTNDRDELEMLVGSVSLTRHPLQGHDFTPLYLKHHKERVKSALQYMYGKEAQKEMSFK